MGQGRCIVAILVSFCIDLSYQCHCTGIKCQIRGRSPIIKGPTPRLLIIRNSQYAVVIHTKYNCFRCEVKRKTNLPKITGDRGLSTFRSMLKTYFPVCLFFENMPFKGLTRMRVQHVRNTHISALNLIMKGFPILK